MRYAVIDTGSNTIRLGIYEHENNALTQLYNSAVFANLAGYITHGRLSQEGISAASDAVNKHCKTAEAYGCKPHVFATAAIRNAENTEEICACIKAKTGAEVDVLSGEEEAYLSFYGAAADFPCQDGVMADVGGGSSEIIVFANKLPIAARSVPLGSLKAFRTYVHASLPNRQEVDAIRSAILNALSDEPAFCKGTEQNLCIVGGCVEAANKLVPALLGESSFTPKAIDQMLERMTAAPDVCEPVIKTIAPNRVQTIAPAMAIYSAVGSFFGAKRLYCSDKGIKEGYILTKLISPKKMP